MAAPTRPIVPRRISEQVRRRLRHVGRVFGEENSETRLPALRFLNPRLAGLLEILEQRATVDGAFWHDTLARQTACACGANRCYGFNPHVCLRGERDVAV